MKFLLKKCLRKKAPEMKPGAILDAVISQSSATACKCLLYKLADYKRGKYPLSRGKVLLYLNCNLRFRWRPYRCHQYGRFDCRGAIDTGTVRGVHVQRWQGAGD